jgi:hypothetical protein
MQANPTQRADAFDALPWALTTAALPQFYRSLLKFALGAGVALDLLKLVRLTKLSHG